MPVTGKPLLEIAVHHPATGLRGILVIHNEGCGTALGGLRHAPSLAPAEVRRLARTMAQKLACYDLPYGGATGGIVASPALPMERAVRIFLEAVAPYLERRWVAGEDLGTTWDAVVAAYDALQIDPVAVARRCAGVPDGPALPRITAETSPLYRGVTGLGVARALAGAAVALDRSPDSLTVSCQGYGEVARALHRACDEWGVRLTHVEDLGGCYQLDAGFPPALLAEASRAGGHLDRQVLLDAGARPRRRGDWLAADVDVLIPAARTGALRRHQADAVRAAMVVEAGNGSVSSVAERALLARGVPVIPDFVAGAGTAVAWGLVVTGRIAPHPARMGPAVGDRVEEVAGAVTTAFRTTGIPPRAAAMAIVRENLRRQGRL